MIKRISFLALLIVSVASFISSETPDVLLNNPSFEDTPQDATTPAGWHPGHILSTPDIQPGQWGANRKASHGRSYVGLIGRSNGTYEMIGQKLTNPLRKGECYNFSLDLAKSSIYDKFTGKSYLKAYGCKKGYTKQELLFKTPIVNHTFWKKYYYEVYPSKNYDYILFEIAYPEDKPIDNNILIDNCSAFISCSGV